MLCPTDKVDLTMSERAGIEIDYCPKCRGVWLDRGELDKIIERSAVTSSESPTTVQDQPRYDDRQDSRSSHDGYNDRQNGKRRKKEGFLGELFDF